MVKVLFGIIHLMRKHFHTQFSESIIDIKRHKTKLSSEFTSAWTQEDCNEFIEVGCSLQQDNEWANESI